ncbi:ROK family protein [Pseudonocardia xinjiangensis]|uniref:ROK family protein n=1 Tax=Pseudonocardia xinjiangensis TaxID=75289 RepID=UPI003D904F6D
MATRSTELLRVAHAHPGITRAAAARLLGVGTGAATEIVARLSQARLLAEVPAARSGARGRPTTVLVPHPHGPLVLAAAITHETWRVDAVEMGGQVLASDDGRHDGADWPTVAAALSASITAFRDRYADRPRALGLSVPGTVSPAHRLDAATLLWRDIDLHELWPAAPVFVAGNDATLAASAESRSGAAVGASVALHLRIEAGLGGAVVDHGNALIGATGAAGEFGHMPFGDPAIACPCGARGCWGTAVDGTALARLLGRPVPRDHVAYARRLITATAPEPVERAAVRSVAGALGRGIAGLVNGIDADLVTLGGLGADLLAAARDDVDAAYRAGLMAYRRDNPPPILPAALGDGGPIVGAAGEAWSALLVTLA